MPTVDYIPTQTGSGMQGIAGSCIDNFTVYPSTWPYYYQAMLTEHDVERVASRVVALLNQKNDPTVGLTREERKTLVDRLVRSL